MNPFLKQIVNNIRCNKYNREHTLPTVYNVLGE